MGAILAFYIYHVETRRVAGGASPAASIRQRQRQQEQKDAALPEEDSKLAARVERLKEEVKEMRFRMQRMEQDTLSTKEAILSDGPKQNSSSAEIRMMKQQFDGLKEMVEAVKVRTKRLEENLRHHGERRREEKEDFARLSKTVDVLEKTSLQTGERYGD